MPQPLPLTALLSRGAAQLGVQLAATFRLQVQRHPSLYRAESVLSVRLYSL